MKIVDKLLAALFWVLMIGGLGVIMYLLIGFAEKKPDVIVKEDTEYFYYKRYEIYNKEFINLIRIFCFYSEKYS